MTRHTVWLSMHRESEFGTKMMPKEPIGFWHFDIGGGGRVQNSDIHTSLN